jgi:hypothetical protein
MKYSNQTSPPTLQMTLAFLKLTSCNTNHSKLTQQVIAMQRYADYKQRDNLSYPDSFAFKWLATDELTVKCKVYKVSKILLLQIFIYEH